MKNRTTGKVQNSFSEDVTFCVFVPLNVRDDDSDDVQGSLGTLINNNALLK